MIRYLDLSERTRTRKMWEDIFSSDSKGFLDYYYTEKTKANQILIVEEGTSADIGGDDFVQVQEVSDADLRMLSMLQLNPYEMFFGGHIIPANYIVGVATDRNHRHQGHMKNLLTRALYDMYEKGEAFTYLMPAAEAIYKPFDFRFIYNQKGCVINKESAQKFISGNKNEPDAGPLISRTGKEKDIPELVNFSNELLSKRYQIYTRRNQEYYQTLLKEVTSEKGEILLFYHNGALLGYCFYAIGEAVEVREPVCKEGYEKVFVGSLLQSVMEYHKDVKISGIDTILADKLEQLDFEFKITKTPMIMARIVNFEELISKMKAKDRLDIKIKIRDSIIPQNNTIFHLFTIEGSSHIQAKVSDENADAEFSIGDVTSFLFGYKRLEELEEFEYQRTDKIVLKELEKICRPEEIFINEVV